MNRSCDRCTVAVALLSLVATAAYAGGWSTITVDDLPDYAVAGNPVTLTFSVRQHGTKLISGLQPTVRATTPQGLQTKASATPTKNRGEYIAILLLPKPGMWTIRIDGGFNPNDTVRLHNTVTLTPLKVTEAETASPLGASQE